MEVQDLAEFLAWVQDNYIDCGDDSYIIVEDDNEDNEEGAANAKSLTRQEVAEKYLREVKGQDV